MKLTRDELVNIIENAGTQINFDKLKNDQMDVESAGADSLDVMNILFGVQEKTGLEIPDEDVENLRTIDQILDYVNRE